MKVSTVVSMAITAIVVIGSLYLVFGYHAGDIANMVMKRQLASDETIAQDTRKIESDPGNPVAYYNRGVDYANKKQYDLAIADYSKAIQLDPNYKYAYNNRGVIYDDKGQYDLAIADYSMTIKLDPSYVYAYNNRGNSYNSKGQYNQAIADLSTAIKLDPKYANAYRNRGDVYNNNGQAAQAIADYNRAVELSTDTGITQYAMTKLQGLGISSAAMQVSTQASEHDKQGVTLAAAGKTDAAITEFTKAIEIAPNYTSAYTNRGMVYLNKQQYSTAITDFSYAIKYDASYELAYEYRAIAYGDEGQFVEALADLDKAVAIDPSDDGAWNNRGMALEELSRPQEAVKSYDTALQLNPNNQNAKDNKSDVIASDYKPRRGCLAYPSKQPCLTHPWTPDRVVYHGGPFSHTEYGPASYMGTTDSGTTQPVQNDWAAIARQIADNYMSTMKGQVWNQVSQASVQGASFNFGYTLQQPQNMGNSLWKVPVTVRVTVSVNLPGYSYSTGVDGSEALTVDVSSRQVVRDEIISYSTR